jgi:peptide/nickel transport system substrate-binding protein
MDMGARVAILATFLMLAVSGSSVAQDISPETRLRTIEMLVQSAGSNPTEFETAQMIAAEWRKLGLDVAVNGMEWARIGERVFQQHDYDTAVVRYAGRAERIDPYHFIYQILHSNGRSNEAGYRSSEYDKYADLQNESTDLQQRRAAVFKAQEISAHDQPIAPIVNRNQIHAYNTQTFEGYQSGIGEGLNVFWNYLELRPKTARKTVRFAYAQDNETLNPTNMFQFRDFQVAQLIYDRLVRIDQNGVPKEWAAESITVVSPTMYRVKLRKGMTFHDGKPVTAEDIKFSVELFREIKGSRLWGLAQPVQEVRAADELTVEFVLKEKFAPFVANTLGQLFILPKHIWAAVPLKDVPNFADPKATGSGPFKLEYWQRDREMKLSRHDGHFSKPAIDGIIRVVFPTVDGIVGALERRAVDFTGWWLEPAEAARLQAVEHLKTMEVPNHGFLAMDFNNRRPPFDQVAFRRALAYAIPKQRILDVLLEKHGSLAFSTIGPENRFWHNPNVEKVNYDLPKAKQILLDAGFRLDGNGRLHRPKP